MSPSTKTDGKRRYHDDESSSYPLPNDEEELVRLDTLQRVCHGVLGLNVIPPIKNPTAILDIGCGSGLWGIEVAQQFPSATVYGVDLSIYPRETPLNCRFLRGNLHNGLGFPDGSLDLVQSRIVMSGVRNAEWPGYAKEIFRVCKPGGWAQLVEASAFLSCDDGSVPEDSAVWEYQKYEHEIWETEQGFVWTPYHIETRLEAAGFVDVETRKFRINGYGNGAEDAVRVWSGVVEPLVADMGRYYPDQIEREKFAERVVNDMRNESYHLYSIL